MVGAPDILSDVSFASAFGGLANVSTRPSFEFQFNALQNSVIDRINKEIEKVNEASSENTVDAFLLLSQRKLETFTENLDTFRFFNSRNAWTIPDLKTKLGELQTASGNGDAATFDSILAQVNDAVGNMQVPNGTTIGIYIADGITAIRRDGLLNVDRAGVTTKITAYSQFTDNAEAQASISAAITRLDNSYNSVILKAEAAEKLRVMTASKLTSVSFQIEAARTAAEAEKAAELAKLREDYGRLLNSISLAFEVNQAAAEQLGKGLFNADDVEPGSVMNLFT